MRIWLLTSEWNAPCVDDLCRTANGYARALAAAGHDVTVFGIGGAESGRSTEERIWYVGLPLPAEAEASVNGELPPDESSAYPHNVISHWPSISWRMAILILEHAERDGPPDLIESQSMYGLPYFLLQRKLTQTTPIANVPIVVDALGSHVHRLAANQQSPYRLPDYWIGRMELFSLRAAAAVLCGSPTTEREVRDDLGGDLALVRFAPTAWRPRQGSVPDAQARGSRASDEPHAQACDRTDEIPITLVCDLPLELRAGVGALVDQCAALWTTGEEFRLRLTGVDSRCAIRDRSMSEILKQRHARWGESGQFFIDAGQLLSRSVAGEIAVFPACGGDFSTWCAETIAGGGRVIAARGGDPATLLGEHSPQVYDPNNPETLRSAMKVALRALRGPSVGLSIADAVHERIALFDDLIRRPETRRTFPSIEPGDRRPAPALEAVDAGAAGRLSIVVPHFNLGEFIAETVANLRAVDWPDREIILVDDGSTDPGSIAAIDRILAENSPDVRVIRTQNHGPATARNTGVAAATGEFIALVDADDLVEPDFFSRAIEVLRRFDDVGFVYSWVRYFGATQGIWPAWNTELPYLLGHNMLTVFIVMRRRDYLHFGSQHRDFASDYEDYDGFVSMVEAGLKGVALPDPLVRYRIRPESRHRAYHDDQSLHLYQLLTRHHGESYRRFGAELFNLQLVNGPARFWSNPASPAFDPMQRIGELEQLHRAAWEEGQRVAADWEVQRRHIEAQAGRIVELQAEATGLSEGWETQQRHIADQRARIEELDQAVERISSESRGLLDEQRVQIETQTRLAAEYEAEARRLGQAWEQVSAHNGQQASRIAELDEALAASNAEATRLADSWQTQSIQIDTLARRIAELEARRGWLGWFRKRR